MLQAVKGRGVQFLLIFEGARPSDTSADERAIPIICEISNLAQEAKVFLLLYPHTGNWIERTEDAVRVADKVNRANVGVMFNLCHWLRVSKGHDYRTRLQQALHRLIAVSISTVPMNMTTSLAGAGTFNRWIRVHLTFCLF